MTSGSFYDDPDFSYPRYWQGRAYETHSELLAIDRLVGAKKFAAAADIGGGFGRLTRHLARFCQHVTLIEPATKARTGARKFLRDLPQVAITAGSAHKTGLPAASQDLVLLVRVAHHLPDLAPAIAEVGRILKPEGWLILEFANSLHAKARVKSCLTGKPILLTPVEKRRPINIRKGTIPFVNHHPDSVRKLLYTQGFVLSRVLSVSNLRSPLLKKLVPVGILVGIEKILQPLLAPVSFGPSLFVLARKKGF